MIISIRSCLQACGGLLAAAMVLWFFESIAIAHGDPLTDWAEQTDMAPVMPHQKPFPTTVVDGFVPDLVAGGKKAYTPCSGTLWVYDYAHGIAGGRERSDPTGGVLEYRAKPPVELPSRDLLVVRSQLGLHLGMPLADAAKLLKVPISAAVAEPNDQMVLYVERDVACGRYRCGSEVVLRFVQDRAVSLTIYHGGP